MNNSDILLDSPNYTSDDLAALRARNHQRVNIPKSLPCEEILISQITANSTWNSRSDHLDVDSLAENIKEHGLLEPLIVTKSGDHYNLVAGFRRFAAIRKLGYPSVRATIVEADSDKAQLINLAENIERKNLRLYDTMRVVYDLSEKKGLKSVRIARDTGLKQSRVDAMVRLWPRLAPTLKDRWAKIPEASWEPTQHQLQEWGSLSHAEQNREWSKWSNDDSPDDPGTAFDEPDEKPERIKKTRAARRNAVVMRRMIRTLEARDTTTARIQIRALKWALGERNTI